VGKHEAIGEEKEGKLKMILEEKGEDCK